MVIKNSLLNSKRGWIKLMEVFISIVLLMGVILIIITRENPRNEGEINLDMYQKEAAILMDIELNDSLRANILDVSELPVDWENFESQLPQLKARIISLTPKNLDCSAKICSLNDKCTINSISGKSIYAHSVVISADYQTYNPRQLKLFCNEK